MAHIIPATRVHVAALSLAMLSTVGVAVHADPLPRPFVIASSSLGDLSPYRTIAQDTLALVVRGDIAAARLRLKDLETAWDKAEPSLKPKDAKGWAALDSAIDAALTDLRTPSPKAGDCAVSLEALIGQMNAASKA